MHSSKERRFIFGITRCNATPTLEVQKSIFHQVPVFIQVFVIKTLLFAVPFGWDLYRHALFFGLLNQRIAVVTPVGKKIFCRKILYQLNSLGAICDCPRRDPGSKRHPTCINREVYFCIEPPFVTPIAWFPPIAPAACG